MDMTRKEKVEHFVSQARRLIDADGVTRQSLDEILQSMLALAGDSTLWGKDSFASPAEGEKQARYLTSEDPDKTYALYLNVMRPGKLIPPHDHTTWACICAVEDGEDNRIFDRLDDGSTPGHAELRERQMIRIEPGHGMALMPSDIHSVHISGDDIIRHLHFYGKALETLENRSIFDLEKNTVKPMSIGVQTRR